MTSFAPSMAALEEARAALQHGDFVSATMPLQGVLAYANVATSEGREAFVPALAVLVEYLSHYGAEATTAVARAANAPSDPDALYDAGYALVAEEFAWFASAVLRVASQLAPDSERILAELATALEMSRDYANAAASLAARPASLANSFVLTYLHAFESALAGDLSLVMRDADRLAAEADDETQRFMATRLAGIARRASVVTPTNERTWHAVLFAGLLLGVRDELEQDTYALCRVALDRLRAFLLAVDRVPERVFFLRHEPSAAALGLAAARLLGVPAVSWPDAGSDLPGLIVTYDLRRLLSRDHDALRIQRPGQIVWDRVATRTAEARYCADLTDTFGRSMTPPWGDKSSLDEDLVPEHWAAQILAVGDPPQSDFEALTLATRLGPALGSHALQLWRVTGARERRWPIDL